MKKRLITNDAELNRVLGGGIVPGSIVLVQENLYWKSTCFAKRIMVKNAIVLYIRGEKEQQIKMRRQVKIKK